MYVLTYTPSTLCRLSRESGPTYSADLSPNIRFSIPVIVLSIERRHRVTDPADRQRESTVSPTSVHRQVSTKCAGRWPWPPQASAPVCMCMMHVCVGHLDNLPHERHSLRSKPLLDQYHEHDQYAVAWRYSCTAGKHGINVRLFY